MAARQDIIVVGASAGAVETLPTLAASLPYDLPATLFVVVHTQPRRQSHLPEILNHAGRVPARHAVDGEAIECGRIYVAPPDRHLVVKPGHVRLSAGPAEKHHRPAIDVTFHSAAIAYGPRVAGVILTGQMDDGTAGLREIQRRGGVTIVQDPDEAFFPSMPRNALRAGSADYTVRLPELAALLVKLSRPDGTDDQDADFRAAS